MNYTTSSVTSPADSDGGPDSHLQLCFGDALDMGLSTNWSPSGAPQYGALPQSCQIFTVDPTTALLAGQLALSASLSNVQQWPPAMQSCSTDTSTSPQPTDCGQRGYTSPATSPKTLSSAPSPEGYNRENEGAKLSERRKAQNRAAQAAYRKRKEDYQAGLHKQISDLKTTLDTVVEENQRLKMAMYKVEHENELLRKLVYQVPCTSRSSLAAPSAPPPAEQGNQMDDIKQEGADWQSMMPAWDIATNQPLCEPGLVPADDFIQNILRTGIMGQNGMTFEKGDVIAAIEEVTGLPG